jgi:hypothetical protein
VQGVNYLIKNCYIYLQIKKYMYVKRKKVNVQNINCILSDLRYLFKNLQTIAIIRAEKDVYKSVLQRVGWVLSRPFYI